jgi:hypothetical protein
MHRDGRILGKNIILLPSTSFEFVHSSISSGSSSGSNPIGRHVTCAVEKFSLLEAIKQTRVAKFIIFWTVNLYL